MSDPHPETDTEIFRDTPLPPSTLADLVGSDPERNRVLMEEIGRVQAGGCEMIPLHLDPLCAFYFVCAVQLALTHPKHSPSGRAVIEEIVLGLERHIGEQCPEMGRLLADGRAIKGGQG